jgi:lipopolysaccharide transport system ATP-binding protein
LSNSAIQVENVSKRYRIGVQQTRDTLTGSILGFISSPLTNLRRIRNLTRFENDDNDNILWALKDVSFDIQSGERIGFIGQNGAGKSTLLKILSRITEPTSGQVTTRGRISSLLEVGTGFHPELTGRENIFLNGSILGLSNSEIKRRFDEIVDFSGITKFIDTPIKRYSTGMKMRLAFSVAAHLEPEILLIDEVLAVGDAEFQQKCLGKMESVAQEGRTVVFVSHNMAAMLRLVDRCILIDAGQIAIDGDPQTVIDAYLEKNTIGTNGEVEYPEDLSKVAQMKRLAVHDAQGQVVAKIDPASDINISLDFIVRNPEMGRIEALVLLCLKNGTPIMSSNTMELSKPSGKLEIGQYHLRVVFPGNILNSGSYIVKGVISLNGKAHDNHPDTGNGIELVLSAGGDNVRLGNNMKPISNVLSLTPQSTLSRID